MNFRLPKATVGATVGTALEWYDFALYAIASALVFPAVFFPGGDPLAATLASFATFAVGFVARPIGGIIIGILGDRYGRRQMLFLTLMLMGISSTLIGLVPGYAAIGVAAPVMLVVLRVLQGFGAGGEYAGATLLAAEHAPGRSRGLHAAIPGAGNALGAMLATGVLTLLSTMLDREAFLSWGWRIAFLASIFVCIAGILIRLRVAESPEFTESAKERGVARFAFAELFRSEGRRVPLAMLASIGPNVASYLPSVYALTYLADSVGAPAWIGLTGILIGNFIKLGTIPLAGWISDRVGRKPVFLAGAISAAAMAYPFFVLLDTGTPIYIWIALVVMFTLCNDAMLAAQSGFMSELFDVRHRYTGVTFSREIPAALIGGTLPFMAVMLTSVSDGSFGLVALYCFVLLLLAALGMALLPETRASAAAPPE